MPDAPRFTAGRNIALKVPPQHRRHRGVLPGRAGAAPARAHRPVPDFPLGSPAFGFGPGRLWVDTVAHRSRGDVWLQVVVDDLGKRRRHLTRAGVAPRDELEPLGGFPGHWICDPAGNVVLVAQAGADTALPGEAGAAAP
jgi:hypothetical protein